jgi:twinkle protein
MDSKVLGMKAAEAFETRGISCETAARFEIYTARSVQNSNGRREVVPDPDGNIIVFPTIEHGTTVAEKYRRMPWEIEDGRPRFWQREGGRRTFWNSDVLDDPALTDGRMPLVITEGEVDGLTAIESGWPLTVSVPDGAPPVPEGRKPDDLDPLDPEAERTSKFQFIWNNRDRLKPIKRFIIASDDDEPGQRLAAELVRRLSAARCLYVTYPEEPRVLGKNGKLRPCKDLNEVCMHFGLEAVRDVLNNAKPYPVRGLYRLFDYPDLPPLVTYKTGLGMLDHNLTIFPGEFMVVTGIPGHGKSTWVLNIARQMSDKHEWRTAIYSPEMSIIPHLRDKLRRIKLGRRPFYLDLNEIARVDGWINDWFLFIDDDPAGNDLDTDLTLDWILDRATDAVLRDGIRLLIIDPWNEVEHARRKDESTGRSACCVDGENNTVSPSSSSHTQPKTSARTASRDHRRCTTSMGPRTGTTSPTMAS